MRRALLIVLFMVAAACSQPHSTSYRDLLVRHTTDKPFADVVDELEFAISERNFRITGANEVGSALRDRGFEGFPDMQVIHFCSLEYAHEVLAIDPDYIAMMPCRITVHVREGKTIITLIMLPEDHPDPRVNAFAARINGLLREIAAFAIEENAVTRTAGS
jgi:uncharacterized protein (DUF302 family)